jgi:hypothetical protein
MQAASPAYETARAHDRVGADVIKAFGGVVLATAASLFIATLCPKQRAYDIAVCGRSARVPQASR